MGIFPRHVNRGGTTFGEEGAQPPQALCASPPRGAPRRREGTVENKRRKLAMEVIKNGKLQKTVLGRGGCALPLL